VAPEELAPLGGAESIRDFMIKAAEATCEFYIAHTGTDGIPYWDTGAPGLAMMGDIYERPAEPYNEHEPVDSSAAAIAAQGLIRFGTWYKDRAPEKAARYLQAGLCVMRTLLDDPYLSTKPDHQGLLLHSVYHRPRDWDAIPAGRKVPCDESSMWGDYHMREAALLVQRMLDGKPYYTFFSGIGA
jgi:unsaturated chondroitin disaccharide hydrolase